jgi:hypothetical protein
MRVTVWIDEEHAPALKQLAVTERRKVADQAAVLIIKGLQPEPKPTAAVGT